MKHRKSVILLMIFAVILTALSCSNPSNNSASTAKNSAPQTQSGIPDRKWWKEAIVYQIYPRSFYEAVIYQLTE